MMRHNYYHLKNIINCLFTLNLDQSTQKQNFYFNNFNNNKNVPTMTRHKEQKHCTAASHIIADHILLASLSPHPYCFAKIDEKSVETHQRQFKTQKESSNLVQWKMCKSITNIKYTWILKMTCKVCYSWMNRQ